MARPTFTNLVADDVDFNSEMDEDLLEQLRDNAASNRIELIYLQFISTDATTATPVTAKTFSVGIPNEADYTGIARRVVANVRGEETGGADGEVRLKEVASGNVGSWVSLPTTNDWVECELTIDAGWLGDNRQFQIEVRCANATGTATVELVDGGITGFVEY